VIAGDAAKDLVFYLGELAWDAIGSNTVKLLMNTKDPLESIMRGAADQARELGGPFRMRTCGPTQLTDEQYEEGLKHWEAMEKERVEREMMEKERQDRIKKRQVTPLMGCQDRIPVRINTSVSI
jgi:hypothetical protein